MSDHDHNPEHLKPLDLIGAPDPRANAFVRFDPAIRDFRPITLEDHHADIARYALSPSVPEQIVTHFETGKNLYLYAWFAYRFYPVADLHAHATLEFALKERIGEGRLREAIRSVGKGKKGLNAYILYAIQQGWVRNEGFQRWRSSARVRAEQRATMELINEMGRTGATEAVFDPSQVEITDQDKTWDLTGVLAESIPFIRNEYAHGSSTLHNQVLGTFELVAEFINQLWPSLQGE